MTLKAGYFVFISYRAIYTSVKTVALVNTGLCEGQKKKKITQKHREIPKR